MLSGNPAATTNANRYVRAAAETANDALSLQATVRDNAPNYGDMSQEYAKQKALNANELIQSAAKVRKVAQDGEFTLEYNKRAIEQGEQNKKAQNRQKMAGVVAAAATAYGQIQRRKEPDAPLTIDYSEFDALYKKRRGEINSDLNEINSRTFKENPLPADAVGGTDPGKTDPTSQNTGTLPMGGKNPRKLWVWSSVAQKERSSRARMVTVRCLAAVCLMI